MTILNISQQCLNVIAYIRGLTLLPKLKGIHEEIKYFTKLRGSTHSLLLGKEEKLLGLVPGHRRALKISHAA